MVMLKVYQISANLVHTELRNATFEGEKIATSIKRPYSGNNVFSDIRSRTPVVFNSGVTLCTDERTVLAFFVVVVARRQFLPPPCIGTRTWPRGREPEMGRLLVSTQQGSSLTLTHWKRFPRVRFQSSAPSKSKYDSHLCFCHNSLDLPVSRLHEFPLAFVVFGLSGQLMLYST